MAVDLSMQLLELQKSSDELNALTDKANEIVRRAETFLRDECRAGGSVAVHVPSLDTDSSEGPEWSTYLGYERHGGEHRVVVTHVVDGDPHETKPWAECSRTIKLKTLDALPQLIQDLLKKVQAEISEMRSKVELLDGTIPKSSGRTARKG